MFDFIEIKYRVPPLALTTSITLRRTEEGGPTSRPRHIWKMSRKLADHAIPLSKQVGFTLSDN
jgi:hypothetical protein